MAARRAALVKLLRKRRDEDDEDDEDRERLRKSQHEAALRAKDKLVARYLEKGDATFLCAIAFDLAQAGLKEFDELGSMRPIQVSPGNYNKHVRRVLKLDLLHDVDLLDSLILVVCLFFFLPGCRHDDITEGPIAQGRSRPRWARDGFG